MSPTFRDAKVIALWELRLEDMPPRGARLMAWCWTCRREAEVPVAAMIERYGGGTLVKQLPHARCTICDRLTGVTVQWPDPPYYRPE